MEVTRRDVLGVTAAGTLFSFPVTTALSAEDHTVQKLDRIHWVEQRDGEMILMTPGGRCLISVCQDTDEKDKKIATWQILDQQQTSEGGNWVKLGRYQTRERAMQIAEEMFK